MGQIDTPEARLHADIQRLVTSAVRSGSIVRTGYHAGMLAETHADSGFTVEDIVEAIARVASERGVPVELSRPGADPAAIRL